MVRSIVRPHRSLWDAAPEIGDVTVLTSTGEPRVNPTEVESWDPSVILDVRVDVRLDPGAIARELGLPAMCVALGVVWECSATTLRGGSQPVAALDSRMTLQVTLPGEWLARQVRFQVVAFLGSPPPDDVDPLSPRIPGSIVWESASFELQLEGAAPEFPMVPVSFVDLGIPDAEDALWALDILNKDLNAPVGGSIVLQINTDNPRGVSVLDRPDDTVSRQSAAAIMGGVARQLLEFALTNEDFDPSADYPEDAFGATLTALTDRLGPDIEAIRSMYRDSKPRLDARIQAIFGV